MIEPDLTDRTVLVTGSSTGIGRHVLLSLAELGAATAVHYRTSADEADAVRAEAAERGAGEAMTVKGDVTDPEDVNAMFARIEAELGPVDVLVNNVGPFAPRRWDELSFETWNLVMEGNVNSTYLCCKRALPAMRERGFGRIVNVGYASAEKGLVGPKNTPYFVAKAGVLMFTRMLAGDTQDDGVTVNAVSPYVAENSDEFPADLPRDRPASFEDLTQAVAFFLEEDSDYLSGVNVEVDGGWLPEKV